MGEADALELGRQAMVIALKVSMPILLSGLIAGVLVSIFQAVTSIQEMTLSYIPKMIAVIIALLVFGSWMLQEMVSFTQSSFSKIPPITSR